MQTIFRCRPLTLAVRSGLLALSLGAATPLLSSMAVQAAQSNAHYQIPSGSLESALRAFIAQSGAHLSFTQAQVKGLHSPGLNGDFSPAEGLRRLLQGSGLQAQPGAGGGYNLLPLAAAPALPATATTESAPVLGAVTVRGHRYRNDLPPAYAGGQMARGGRLGLLGNVDYMSAPFNITSYTNKTLRDQQVHTVADVMQNEPSVYVANNQTGINEDFQIRGFAVTGLDTAINGMYGLSSQYRAAIDTWADRVEVLKGPSAMLGGMPPGGSVGGSVNVLTKRAGEDPLARIGVSYLSDSKKGTSADLSRRFGANREFGVRANGLFSSGDTYLDRNHARNKSGSLGLDYTTERLRLTGDYIYQHEDSSNPPREFSVISPLVTKVPNPPDNDTNYPGYGNLMLRNKILMLHGEYDITDKLTLYAGWGDSLDNMDGLAGSLLLLNNKGRLADYAAWEKIDNHNRSMQGGLRYQFDTGPLHHHLNASLDKAVHNQDMLFEVGAFIPWSAHISRLSDPGHPKVSNSGMSGHATPEAQVETHSLALSDTIAALDDRIQFTLGVRRQEVESGNFNYNWGDNAPLDKLFQTAPAGSPMGNAYDEKKNSPMYALSVRPWQHVALYANYIEGLSQGDTAPLTATNPGTILAPFQAKQKELGVKGDWGNFGATLSAFEIRRPVGTLVNNTFTDGGKQRNRGLELSLFGQPWEGIRVMGGTSYIKAEQTHPADPANKGNDAVGVPRWRLNLGGEWDTPFFHGLTLWSRARYTDEAYVDAANQLKLPDWWNLDLGARYAFQVAKKPVTLNATLKNALDKDYWGLETGPAAGYMFLGNGRTFELSASVDL